MEPTKEWIEEQKKKYGKVFKGYVGKSQYIFRTLSRKEHLEIQKNVFPTGMPSDPAAVKPEDNSAMEDATLALVVLWPEKLDTGKLDAGVAVTLVPQILSASGFVAPSEPEEL